MSAPASYTGPVGPDGTTGSCEAVVWQPTLYNYHAISGWTGRAWTWLQAQFGGDDSLALVPDRAAGHVGKASPGEAAEATANPGDVIVRANAGKAGLMVFVVPKDEFAASYTSTGA